MNPSEISEEMEATGDALPPRRSAAAETSSSELSPSVWGAPFSNPPWLRLGYALEFFIAVIAIISLWSEVGGEAHLELMPWYFKLGCILALAWCCVRFTASVSGQPSVWNGHSIRWLAGIVLLCALMGGVTYYYHLHEEPDSNDDDDTATAVYMQGTVFDHGSYRTWLPPSFGFLERSRTLLGN